MSNNSESKNFFSASEAYFSFDDIFKNIECRLQRLEQYAQQNEFLQSYLEDNFRPFFQELKGWVKPRGMGQFEERTLSSSDFGFHNALRNNDQGIIFLDFEYFGWDDPAKTVSDFLLHPAMMLSDDLKKRFVRGVCDVFKEHRNLSSRIESVYPFFGLKWCLIFLNEFIPADLQRRNFAQGTMNNRKELQQKQLTKACHMLDWVKQTYQNFPYKI